jgi:hypothetical protein
VAAQDRHELLAVAIEQVDEVGAGGAEVERRRGGGREGARGDPGRAGLAQETGTLEQVEAAAEPAVIGGGDEGMEGVDVVGLAVGGEQAEAREAGGDPGDGAGAEGVGGGEQLGGTRRLGEVGGAGGRDRGVPGGRCG